MKNVSPSLRVNRRYLLIDGHVEDVKKAILDYIWILGWAKAAPVFLGEGKHVILSINRKEITNVRAALVISQDK